MSCLGFVRDLFRVESLDTRFKPDPEEAERNKKKATKSRWRSLEFYFYALNFVIFVPLMVYTAVSAGFPSVPGYKLFRHKLSPGWMGRPVDNSDAQYSGFRDQFPILVVLAVMHPLCRWLLGAQLGTRRQTFDFLFGIIFVAVLHGTSAIKVLAILMVNFWIGTKFQSVKLSWAFAVSILFSNELLHGYPVLTDFEFSGLLSAWQIFFKCTMMRMLSYNVDYIQAYTRNKDKKPKDKKPKDKEPNDKEDKASNQHSGSKVVLSEEMKRISTPLPLAEYNVMNYIGYCLYAPLYLAGPIVSYNDFERQSQQPLTSISLKRTATYAIRFIICLLCMEFILHWIPVVAISETRAWKGLTPAQVSMVGFFNLVVIWLKLLLPWRFFRLWSLMDGIDPPENMVRCVANNYSALSFWRSWHRSFHRWVIRYLYIPLGGSKQQLRNSLLVFAFVAIWHDIQLRLFVWGFLIVLFVIPEIVARKLVPYKKFGQSKWYRIVAGAGAVANIWMMLIANLVGFAVGPDGIKDLLNEMLKTTIGLRFTIMVSLLLYVGSQVMFEYREDELRNGIDMKC